MSNASADSPTALPLNTDKTAKLAEQLFSKNLKRQLSAVTELASADEPGIAILIDFFKTSATSE
ncbi:MAG: GUN4 N-terminal ARM-like repeat domain-containing protein, partial [Cyanobacteria bacterium P01_B01_bin.77]